MTGFQNENEIIKALNGKNFANLNANLQKMVFKINDNKISNSITAKKYAGKDKADLSVILDGKESKISVKKGTGNSVHQEPIEGFIDFLSKEIENDNVVFDNMRHFIWGDETLDGKGNKENRISASDYKKKYPQKVALIQNYLDKYKAVLIERFLILGSVSNNKIDYLYYGTVEEGIICKTDDFLNYAIQNNCKSTINIGILSFQAWNRNINGGTKSEHKRGQIQLKWGTLKQDIRKI
ncbi:hypothetical protein Fleli_2223 [Bernardetia litoralis DSM 6794]|uniref:Uncharacterized protein n=1 Tax=Bernardetia litoralis (strain ATCC 23117 / DSM 6794 / NBRC 15988 / NCIMB 1366 / Fx l1 / Sio-4) TaxID=880071 RepID=I4AKW6_BERLS|nr:hypothetical protein [Bernardetia litoralis]AFM04601.1 hypothetical protein Fleli_2223 [Bernardetia litoralis DSM 6794]